MSSRNEFLTIENSIEPWNRTYYQNKAKFFYPKNLNELLKFRKFLKSSNLKYSVKTGNCSYDSKSMPTGEKSFVISLRNFNKVIKIDKLKHTVLVQSGIKTSDLVKILKENKYKIFCVPGGEKISLGGAISANAIGKDSNSSYGSFGDNVLSLKILTENNKIINLSRSSKKFKNLIGGFGMNGLILEAKLKIKKIKSENVNLSISQFSNIQELIKNLNKKNEYNYAQLDPFFREQNFGVIFSANTSANKENYFKAINLNYNFFEKILFKFVSIFINQYTWKIFYSLFFFINKKKSKILDLHNFHYSSKYKHMIPLIHLKGIDDYEILIKSNLNIVLEKIIKFLKFNKIFCVYIVIKKIFKSKNKYFYSFNDNGYAIALSLKNDKKSLLFYNYLKYLIKNYRITINLAKTDKILLNKNINKSSFMSLYKKKILKNGKISRKRT